ncbi:hypothetical protein GAP32_362 [Cronobacter phage vB_CsaM_GAP32]|uniref:Uncharacterized protein n=1 Tax=Cronobacter phage vB_CsaM_GAP32 TaxID=1141136 RepID=K4F7N0_9CAUD|nr:hypothetical protein GAP32_362 [Cronobacter phage vB_CsaM_GAP32]AFC21812.1 hypothetical protein GAP32_362 [Cronobacter phage vB_CsaM_GAP32]
MNQFASVVNMKADELEFKFSEFYQPWNSTKLNYDTVVFTETFNININISERTSSVHFMDNIVNDGNTKRTVHVQFRTDEDEGYSVSLFKMNISGDENDFMEDYDGIDSIPDIDLRRCSLDIETLRAMAKLGVEIVENLKKNETIIKSVL